MQPIVLLVEDHPTLRMLVQKQFEILGLTLEIATCGRVAIDKTKNAEYSMILMDISMPDMSGFEVTSHIREHELKSGRKRTPIVAMTAYSEKEASIAAGMDGYIQKPVLLQTLRETCAKFIDEYAL